MITNLAGRHTSARVPLGACGFTLVAVQNYCGLEFSPMEHRRAGGAQKSQGVDEEKGQVEPRELPVPGRVTRLRDGERGRAGRPTGPLFGISLIRFGFIFSGCFRLLSTQ